MSASKKYYESIAKIIRENGIKCIDAEFILIEKETLVSELVRLFEEDNSAFDEEKFRKAVVK